jgi:hypothetical protein
MYKRVCENVGFGDGIGHLEGREKVVEGVVVEE